MALSSIQMPPSGFVHLQAARKRRGEREWRSADYRANRRRSRADPNPRCRAAEPLSATQSRRRRPRLAGRPCRGTRSRQAAARNGHVIDRLAVASRLRSRKNPPTGCPSISSVTANTIASTRSGEPSRARSQSEVKAAIWSSSSGNMPTRCAGVARITTRWARPYHLAAAAIDLLDGDSRIDARERCFGHVATEISLDHDFVGLQRVVAGDGAPCPVRRGGGVNGR